jgi:hypothetical protein
MNRRRRLFLWLKNMLHWLWELQVLWTALAVVILAFLVFAVFLPLEAGIRWAGFFLQALGLVAVAFGLEETRKLFGRPSTWEWLSRWWRRRPSYHPKSVTIRAGGASASMGASVATITAGHRPGASLEERVAALERDFERLQEQVTKAEQQLRDELQKLHTQERQEREEADKQLKKLLEELSVGGLHLEIRGLIWLFFGIAFATVPGELAWLVQALF